MKDRVRLGEFYPLGVTKTEKGFQFVWNGEGFYEFSIGIWNREKEISKINVPDSCRKGNLFSIVIEKLSADAEFFCFYRGNEKWISPFARELAGMKEYGKEKTNILEKLPQTLFDWKADVSLKIPYENSIIYGIHVRGFTKTCRIKEQGTFAGLEKKIPYIKSLGATAIELMPAYEFDEVEAKKDRRVSEDLSVIKVNYWGYKRGFYFSPKSAYAYGEDAVSELKNLVRSLHENGLEIILQLFFPKETDAFFVLEVSRFWVMEYHIDGIHYLGENIPIQVLKADPLLAETKLILQDFNEYDTLSARISQTGFRNVATRKSTFLYDMRKYLKGDDDCLNSFLHHMRDNDEKQAVIHYMADYNGFTLMDAVSYERKHNEENGENNQDGEEYNLSWNCGAEGFTRKKSILQLRRKQLRNAAVFLLLAQGTPYLQGGDEFGQSQDGNNNPYCQDNEITWIDWKLQKKNSSMLEEWKELIAFRMKHPVFHNSKVLRIMDSLSCGYPDVSYHGKEAWQPEFANYNRHIGVMYCGKYALKEDGSEDASFYIAYNMHWEKHSFSLPRLQKGMKWELCMDTSAEHLFTDFNDENTVEQISDGIRQIAMVKARTIHVYQAIYEKTGEDRNESMETF